MSAKISPMAKGLVLGSVAAAMLVLAGSNALAQDTAKDAAKPEGFHHGPPHFNDLDTNKDGNVDKAEFTAPMLKHFDAMDANHDGVVSKAEFDDFLVKHMHGHHDRDGGEGPPPEGRGPHDRERGGHEGQGHEGQGHEGWGHEGGGRDGHPMGPPDLMDMDANHDGKISFDEFTAHMKAHFDKLDANHNGFIEASELPKPMGGDMPPPPGDKPAGK